jgi:hypothetical protein
MATASEQIDKHIAELPGWRGEAIAQLRRIINESDPKLQEGWKWGTPVWTAKGNVVALGAFKEHVKVNFFKGAHLDDPRGIFNAGLDAKESRSIDLREGDPIHEAGLQALIRAAVDYDASKR